ncbi:LETM1-like protein [Actinidia rufa]|uniref:LETM1-like protein n=1 Tax=Actinidia rufa TaxID=165716 RepID=A0A7J0FEF3_9ERIC|nr:LETM1-like protein [Actinidia rufa]
MVKMEALEPFELEGKIKLTASAPYTSKLNEKEQSNYSVSRSNLHCGAMPTCHPSSSRVTLERRFLSRALASSVSSATNSEDEQTVIPAHNPEIDFNRVHSLVWVLHESARSFSLAIQAHELSRSGPELAKAWVGVDVHAWHKHTAYQVAVYALLKAAIEVELFLSHKRSNNASAHEIISPKMNYLGDCIESQLNMRHPKLVQWFRMVELPRVAGLFIPLFKKWSMEYAGSGVAGIILAISCCAAVKKLGAGRVSCPLFSVAIEDVLIELMDLSHSLVSVDKLYSLATEAGFEEDFLLHFGTKVLPGNNIEEVEFWIGLVQKKLSTAFHRESVISGKQTFGDKVQENTLATLGLFAFLGRETRLFLSEMGIKDLDEQVKAFLSYLECGSLLIYPEFSSLSEHQLFMEVVTDEIGWLDFYAAFSINSTQRPLGANLLAFLLQSELPKIAERGASDSSPSSQVNGRANSSVILETHPKLIELMNGGGHQHGAKLSMSTNPAMLDPIGLEEVGYNASESEPFHKSLLRKSTIKLISASSDIWMGTRLLFVDILDAIGLLRKQLRGHKITKRERRKIKRTLADIASLVPITILMLLPVSAVGHAAMLAAIQKYMPCLIPTPYSSERLDIVKQLKRTKKMKIQSQSTIEDASSKLV